MRIGHSPPRRQTKAFDATPRGSSLESPRSDKPPHKARTTRTPPGERAAGAGHASPSMPVGQTATHQPHPLHFRSSRTGSRRAFHSLSMTRVFLVRAIRTARRQSARGCAASRAIGPVQRLGATLRHRDRLTGGVCDAIPQRSRRLKALAAIVDALTKQRPPPTVISPLIGALVRRGVFFGRGKKRIFLATSDYFSRLTAQ